MAGPALMGFEGDDRARWDADSLRLVERIQAGEHELVATLYERYFDRLYGYLSSLVHCAADAEDLAQQTFEEVIEDLRGYELRPSASFRSWLFAIARHRAIDHQRKHGRVEVTAPHVMRRQMAKLSSDAHDLHGGLSWISDADLATALLRLPALPREVVLLRYVGDFELAEIATVVGATENAVKQLHRRALIVLRERLGLLSDQASSFPAVFP